MSYANVAITNTYVDKKYNTSNASAKNIVGPGPSTHGHRMRSFTYSNPRTTESERVSRLVKHNLLNSNKTSKETTIYENLYQDLSLLKPHSLPESVTTKKRPKPAPKPQITKTLLQNYQTDKVYENSDYLKYNKDVSTNDNAIYESISDDAKAVLSNEKNEDEYYVDINTSSKKSVMNTLSNDPTQDSAINSYIDMSGNKESAPKESDVIYIPMHRKGDFGCKYNKENPYFSLYSLNDDLNIDHPFQEGKQKLERLPCYCRNVKELADMPEEIYYSCENLHIGEEEIANVNNSDSMRDDFKKKFNKLTQRVTNYM